MATFRLDAFKGQDEKQLKASAYRLLRACGHREQLLKLVISRAPGVMKKLPEAEREQLRHMLCMED